jgi:hypothetical protein
MDAPPCHIENTYNFCRVKDGLHLARQVGVPFSPLKLSELFSFK